MQRILYSLFLLALPSLGFSQYYWEVGGSLGASNYLGEMGGEENTRKDFIADLKFEKTKFAAGAFVRYKAHPVISVKGALNYCRIAGDDALSTNPGRNGRNLSFRNDIFELSCEGEYFFYEINDLGHTYRYRNNFRLYGFLGVAGFFSNPKANLNGTWYALQPLKTEAVDYSRIGVAIPSGIGLYFTIEKKYRIGWELGWRKTFTDYLDDVSTVYADPQDIPTVTGIQLANRTDPNAFKSNSEIPHPNNYKPGSKRGDPSHKDAYFFSTINGSYVIRGRSKFYRSKYSHIFKGKKYKKRKIRAKF